MTINDFLEDYDHNSLSDEEWNEQMEEAVYMYNEEYRASFEPNVAIANYKSWKMEKNPMFNENWEDVI